jgi:hypothetical protein
MNNEHVNNRTIEVNILIQMFVCFIFAFLFSSSDFPPQNKKKRQSLGEAASLSDLHIHKDVAPTELEFLWKMIYYKDIVPTGLPE